MREILQTTIPYDPLSPRPLPGIQPLNMAEWLIVDDAYSAQMAERARLLTDHRAAVVALDPAAQPAARELLDVVLAWLSDHPGFVVCGTSVTRPDGQAIDVRLDDPLGTLGHLVQEDFCLMERRGEEHVLTGAVLCFPSFWTLAEKFMHPMTRIHVPVASYTDDMAKRVQRLFDGVQIDRPLWRFNTLWHVDPTLYHPQAEAVAHMTYSRETARYLRSERQCLRRLPKSGAVVFSIHTYMLSADRFRVSDG